MIFTTACLLLEQHDTQSPGSLSFSCDLLNRSPAAFPPRDQGPALKLEITLLARADEVHE
jgi:hypothetical protein